jgi:hypothetical protein
MIDESIAKTRDAVSAVLCRHFEASSQLTTGHATLRLETSEYLCVASDRTTIPLSAWYRAPRQLTFVLRIWETRSIPPEPAAIWSASLRDVMTGEKEGFADLDELIAFLQDLKAKLEAEGVLDSERDESGAEGI